MKSLFPPSTLALFRAMNVAALDSTAALYRPTTARGAGGVTTTTYPGTPTVEDLACRVSLAGVAQENLTADALKLSGDYVLVFAVNTDVRVNDRLEVVVPVNGVDQPVTVEVTGIGVPKSNATQLKVTARTV